MPEYDIAIIGSGPGGYVAAIRAAQLGLKAAVVEKDSVGGLCLNWGCIPSKALLYSAELINLFQRGPEFGIGFENLTADLGVAVNRSREVVARFVSGVEQLLQQNKVTLIRGTASLASPTSLRIEPSGEVIQAKNIIVAAGGFTRSLPNVAIDGVNVITSREALDLRQRPASVIIVGGGAIGVEFGYLYRSYGAEVTIIEVLPRLLPNEDEDVSRQLERAFRQQGITIKASTRVEDITNVEGGVNVRVSAGESSETLHAEKVLIGIGFGPNTEKLGLEKAGVATDRGWITVDEYCRTNVPTVWAIGDVTGKLLLAHVASHQGVTAVEKIAGLEPPPLEYVNIPRAVYCQPQVASLGLTEAQAKEQGISVRTGRFPFRANGKSMAIGENEGFVKVVAEEATGQIVGWHIIGHNATEMLGEATLGALLETTNTELGYAVHAHPTMSEAIKEAALAVTGEAIHFYTRTREPAASGTR